MRMGERRCSRQRGKLRRRQSGSTWEHKVGGACVRARVGGHRERAGAQILSFGALIPVVGGRAHPKLSDSGQS